MRKHCSKSIRGRDSGIALLMTALLICVLAPIVGLSIDAGVLYLAKAKLSMAVDAGAIAGARALSRGISEAEQTASAQSTARSFVRANFAADAPGENLQIPVPNIDASAADRRSVLVSASVRVPLYFMRMLGVTGSDVQASATAVRRDVNVVVVLDRSGSLASSGACEAVKANAINFVNRFSEGRDTVGLVTFASNSRDDFPIADNFHTAAPNVVNTIDSLTCTGSTNTSQALWQGYTQLTGLNDPSSLNVLLFFTDGQPTAFTGKFKIRAASTCVNKQSRIAALTIGSNGANVPIISYGLLNHAAAAQPVTNDFTVAPESNGCAYAANWPATASNVGTDVDKLPLTDYYGNRLVTGFRSVEGASPSGDVPQDTPEDAESTAVLSPTNIHHASINAADEAGLRIRNGATVRSLGRGLPGVVTFSVGLGNASGGVQQDFMRRVSNDPEASNYDPQRPAGLYVYAPQTYDLTQAFNRIASEILRLAR